MWRRILPRVAEDDLGLELSVLSVEESETTLGRALAGRPEEALLLGLARSGTPCGLAIADTAVLGALIEVQTTGSVSSSRRDARPGTSTDFALLSHVIDRWIAATTEAFAVGAPALRCVRLFPDNRAVQLGLDEGVFRETRVELEFGGGRRRGFLSLISPKDDGAAGARLDLSELRTTLLPLATQIEAVLCRVKLPLSRVLDLEVGDMLELDGVSVRKIMLEAPLGHRVSRAHLGQSRGFRAVRILGPSEVADDDDPPASASLAFDQAGPGSEAVLDAQAPAFEPQPHDVPSLAGADDADDGLQQLPSLPDLA